MIKVYKDALTEDLLGMRESAMEARERCRFLKSTTKVGCCIESDAKNWYSGCNFDFEWGIAVHAEESAISSMINDGDFNNEEIVCVYIYAEADALTSCGDCRDKLMLYAVNEDIPVYIDNGETISVFTLKELLPYAPKR